MKANVLRNELIPCTIKRAVDGCPFYASLYGSLDISRIQSVDDLALLPLTDKSQIRDAGSRAVCGRADISHLQNTSGSSDDILILHRSRHESDFIGSFFGELIRDNTVQPRPIILSLQLPSHGTATAIPAAAFVVTQVLTDSRTARNTLQLLLRQYEIPGVEPAVSLITGGVSQVLLLTSYLSEKGYTIDQLPQLRSIIVTGEYVSKRCRRFIETFWQTGLVDRYSQSEIFGGATLSTIRGGYIFDPFVVPEVIQLGTSQPLEDGIGELVLTSLYPFVQNQPLIRYRTGDLFEVSVESDGNSIYRFLGRIGHALFDPNNVNRLLIDGTTLYESLDMHALIARTRHALSVDLCDHSATGKPMASGQCKKLSNGYAVQLDIHCVVNPNIYPEESERIRTSILAYLMEHSPSLCDDVRQGRASVSIRLLPPSEIRSGTNVFKFFETDTSTWTGGQPEAFQPRVTRSGFGGAKS